jgi:hypothetical protein
MEFDQARRTCGACEFWTGQRRADPLRQTAIVNSPAAPGGCSLPGEGQARPAIGQCPRWQVWDVLTVKWNWGRPVPRAEIKPH